MGLGNSAARARIADQTFTNIGAAAQLSKAAVLAEAAAAFACTAPQATTFLGDSRNAIKNAFVDSMVAAGKGLEARILTETFQDPEVFKERLKAYTDSLGKRGNAISELGMSFLIAERTVREIPQLDHASRMNAASILAAALKSIKLES